MIHVKCYACGASHEVSDDKAGKKLKCRECGVVVTIPQSDGLTDELRMPAGTPRPPLPQTTSTGDNAPPATSGGGNRGMLIGLSIGGGLLVIAGVVVGILFALGTFDAKKTEDDDNRETTAKTAESPSDKLEQAHRDFVRLLNEYAGTLNGLQNNASSVEAAVAPVGNLCREMQALASRVADLPRLEDAEETRIEQKYANQVRAAVASATRAANGIPGAAQFHRGLRSQMQCFGNATDRVLQNDRQRMMRKVGS